MPRGRRKPGKGQEHLFTPEVNPIPLTMKPPSARIWTENKSRLIERYLYYFLRVTRHGTYIDAFAGPQYEHQLEDWAARRVIESQPGLSSGRPRLRHFHLFEKNPNGLDHLRDLRDDHPQHDIQVHSGDVNKKLPKFLGEKEIPGKEAVFALLDQRGFECHWSTVDALARYQDPRQYKIELFYFLAAWWMRRSRNLGEKKGLAWWGRSDYGQIVGMDSSIERAQAFCQRIAEEFSYGSVVPWPIYSSEAGNSIAYFMIHASDHSRAPKLMHDAYSDALETPKSDTQLALEFGVEESTDDD